MPFLRRQGAAGTAPPQLSEIDDPESASRHARHVDVLTRAGRAEAMPSPLMSKERSGVGPGTASKGYVGHAIVLTVTRMTVSLSPRGLAGRAATGSRSSVLLSACIGATERGCVERCVVCPSSLTLSPLRRASSAAA